MSRELLYRSGSSASHRQVRAERVAKNVRPIPWQTGSSRRSRHEILNHLLRQRLTVVLIHDARPAYVTMLAKGCSQTSRQR